MRIGLTISGAVSLGAFEGGALAALLTGTQAIQAVTPGKSPPLRVDAIGAASAGAITAVAAARILTAGLDPVWVMQRAWVTEDSLDSLLRGATADAPLSMDHLSKTALDVLNDQQHVNPAKIQQAPVAIELALTNLRCLGYTIHKISAPAGSQQTIEASTYFDWGRFAFSPGAGIDEFCAPGGAVDTALASGANPLGFAPRKLARDSSPYVAEGVTNLPANAGCEMWFTDGGTIDNEPLGRTLDRSNDIDLHDPPAVQDRRVQVLIHPFPSAPPPAASLSWAHPDRRPTWLRTLSRVFMIIRAQNLYSDIRQAEKTNSQIRWSDELKSTLAGLLTKLLPEEREKWRDALRDVVDGIERELAALPRYRGNLAEKRHATTVEDFLDIALDRVSGLATKNVVGIEVVSPYLAKRTDRVALDRLLAGEFLESFGGFFHEGLRRSDFALGFVCMLNWMESALPAYGLDTASCGVAIDAALRAFYGLPAWQEKNETKDFTDYGLTDTLESRAKSLGLTGGPSWVPRDFGEMTLGDLGAGEKWLFARVLGRVATVLRHDLWLKFTGRDEP